MKDFSKGVFQICAVHLRQLSFLSKHNEVTIIAGIMIEVLRILKIRPLY